MSKEGYSRFTPNTFNIKASPEVLDWTRRYSSEEVTRLTPNLRRVRGHDAVEYSIHTIPEEFRRSKFDSAALLVIKYNNGMVLGKRHCNSQFMNLKPTSFCKPKS